VLIDDFLASQGLNFSNCTVWNPYLEKDDAVIQGLKVQLLKAANNFPMMVEIEI
jgi:hypothetical protein